MSVGVDFDFAKWIAARRGALEQQAREGAAYAFSGERKFRRTLTIARPVTMALEATTRLWRDVARTDLLASAVKVTDQQYPRVYHAAKAAGAALRVTVPSVFAAPSDTIKVAVLGTEDAPHLIVNLKLAERLDDTQLIAAIGHELGHIQNGHIFYATALHYLRHSAAFYVRWVVQPAIMALQAWSRRAEVTCDRAALLAVRDLDKTLQALVAIELGLDSGAAFSADDYLKALPDVKRGFGRYTELFRSHPQVPKRVQALRLFAGSAMYAQATGGDPAGKPSLADVDKQVADLISVL
ncbi:MAG TPA: M48 family metallopeptidase [Kofleriaceae bacterium]|jgi:Zn-dependent protease with chaperone function|nr:M48 family metallopeptidase [Kofleriaceae bacterium]